eukprot:6232371-Prymnesium_polylepis.1
MSSAAELAPSPRSAARTRAVAPLLSCRSSAARRDSSSSTRGERPSLRRKRDGAYRAGVSGGR